MKFVNVKELKNNSTILEFKKKLKSVYQEYLNGKMVDIDQLIKKQRETLKTILEKQGIQYLFFSHCANSKRHAKSNYVS